MPSVVKKLLILLILLGIGYTIYSRFMGGPPNGGMMMGGAPPVSVAEVIERNVQQWSEFSGRLVAVDQADIRPRVSGTIESVHFKNGAMVKKDDLLFVIDPRPFEAAAAAAHARAVQAESEFQRAKTLLADKAIAQRDYDQRKNAAEVARADYTRAKLDLEYTKIRAPFSGKIGRAEITAGNLVEAGPGAPVLTSIVSNHPLYADFEVDEDTFLRYIQRDAAHNGDIPVMMSPGDGATTYTGRIESFDNRLNPQSGTIRVRAVFDNEDGLLVPGLFARIKLGSASEAPVLLITDRAVGTDQSKKFVLVVGAENKAEYREVTLDAMADGLRIVRAGLAKGEKIIVNGTQRARPGMPVTPEMVPMDAPPAPAAAPPAATETPAAPETPPEHEAVPETAPGA